MKKIISFTVLFIIIAAAVYYYTYERINYEELNILQKSLTSSVYFKFGKLINELPPEERAIVDYALLMNELNLFEKHFAEKIFSINPAELGFLGPYYSKEKADNLVKIEPVVLQMIDKEKSTGIQYCPQHSFADYQFMMVEMETDIGKRLFVGSGYRSPGRQAYLFFHYLTTSSEFSLNENARWIAMPGYSEHGSPVNNAIDFINSDGITGFTDGQTAEDFEILPEYKWLLENAHKFNFYLSYPKNNKLGVAYEPWHWHWDDKKTITN